jgi:hypothetical protein
VVGEVGEGDGSTGEVFELSARDAELLAEADGGEVPSPRSAALRASWYAHVRPMPMTAAACSTVRKSGWVSITDGRTSHPVTMPMKYTALRGAKNLG